MKYRSLARFAVLCFTSLIAQVQGVPLQAEWEMPYGYNYSYDSSCNSPWQESYTCDVLDCCDEECCEDWGFRFDADFLWLKASGDTFYATYATFTNTGAGVEEKDVGLTEKFHWEPGYELGIGYRIPCTCIGLNLSWTYLLAKACDGRELPISPDASVFQLIAASNINDGNGIGKPKAIFVNTHSKLKFNFLDLTVSQSFSLCNWSLRPIFGIRGVKITQNFTSAIDEVDFYADIQGGLTDVFTADFSDHSNYKGAGVLGGLEARYFFCDDWSIYGKGTASWVWGRNHYNSMLETDHSAAGTLINGPVRIRNRDVSVHSQNWTPSGITHVEIGVSWTSSYCGYNFAIDADWEHYAMYNLNRLFNQDLNIYLQGVRLGAHVEF